MVFAINTPPPLFSFDDGVELACARLVFGFAVMLGLACIFNKKWHRKDGE